MSNITNPLIAALSGVHTTTLEVLGKPSTPFDIDSQTPSREVTEALAAFVDFQEKLLYTSTLMGSGLGFVAGHLEDSNNPPSNTTTAVLVGASQLITYVTAPRLLGFEGETTADAWRFLLAQREYTGEGLKSAFQTLRTAFATQASVMSALQIAESELEKFRTRYRYLGFLIGCANAYHGYKRNNNSLLYGTLWGFMGGAAGLGLAAKQGYARNVVGSSEM